MSSVLLKSSEPYEDDWPALYGERWGRDLVPEAMSHPAKYSRGLIRKIYEHAFYEGWISKGSSIVDPFGGIAGGAFDAMLKGCHWRGVELEQRFVDLGGHNIALWNERYSRMPGWGSAELRQGDSRQLANLLACGDLCVSSPPFTESLSSGKLSDKLIQDLRARGQKPSASGMSAEYGRTPGNLGNMSADGFDAAISSPPFLDNNVNVGAVGDTPAMRQQIHNSQPRKDSYGASPGQLGNVASNDFWQASRQILEQLHQVIRPGGHAIFVVKDFVRKKQRVPFGDQWRQLCEAAGFVCLHHHRAQLVERYGAQTSLTGETSTVEIHRKSFFRRLAEKKGSPAIDYESVYCFVKGA